MQQQRVESWHDFFKLVEQLSSQGWAFRGQLNERWPLVSTLQRYLSTYAPHSNWKERELRAIKVFSRKAHHFLDDPSTLNDTLRCLALMQHHGAPTRLIDFSKSPFVAAHFALERARKDAAVFAINTPYLFREAAPSSHSNLTRKTIDPRETGNLETYFFENDYPVIWAGEPDRMDQRTVSQSGTFIIPGRIHEPIDDLLTHYESDEALLIKIILPIELRNEAMQGLYRMNITNATLFPDLDGLARSIAQELEVTWAGGVNIQN